MCYLLIFVVIIQILNKNDKENPTQYEILPYSISTKGVWVDKEEIIASTPQEAKRIFSTKIPLNRFYDPLFKPKGDSIVIRIRGVEWKICSTYLERFKYFKFKYGAHLAAFGICAAASLQFFEFKTEFFDNRFMNTKYHDKLKSLHKLLFPFDNDNNDEEQRKSDITTDTVTRDVMYESYNYNFAIQHSQDFGLDHNYVADPNFNDILKDNVNEIPDITIKFDKINLKTSIEIYQDDGTFNEDKKITHFRPVDGDAYIDYCNVETLSPHIDYKQFGVVGTRKIKGKSALLDYGPLVGGNKHYGYALQFVQEEHTFNTLSGIFCLKINCFIEIRTFI